jgi:hypothetical protein
MKKIFPSMHAGMLFMVSLSLAFIVVSTSCETDSDGNLSLLGLGTSAPECTKNADCNANEICSGNVCVIPVTAYCEDLGGYCSLGSPVSGFFTWYNYGCKGTTLCQLPQGTCQGIGGIITTGSSCSSGYEEAKEVDDGSLKSGEICCLSVDPQ